MIAPTMNVTALTARLFTNTSLAARLWSRLDVRNLRHIFYLITPYETAVPTLADVPNYNIQVSAWWMTLILAEFVVLWLFGHDDRFALNDSMTSVFAGMCSQCFNYVYIWEHWRVLDLPWDSPWTWLLCFLTQDLAYYIGHRAVHECGFFWGLHNIHHSSEYYNLSTALRQAAFQDAGLALYDVVQALLIPPPIFLVHRYFSEIFQFWMHTSLLGSLGPLGYILNTPSHHRVHHGRNPYCIDRNFGGVLIIWDRMFHTFEAERKDDPPIYGLVHAERSFNQLWLQFHVLKELLFDKWRMRDEKAGVPLFPGVGAKLRALVYPPGYFPGVDVRAFCHWWTLRDHTEGIPEPERPAIKYNPPVACWLKAYCMVHFLFLLAAFMHFEYDRDALDWPDFALKLAFFICTMQAFGAFFDKKPYAQWLELFRDVGVCAYFGARVALDAHGLLPNRAFIFALFFLSATFWAVRALRRALRRAKLLPSWRKKMLIAPLKNASDGNNKAHKGERSAHSGVAPPAPLPPTTTTTTLMMMAAKRADGKCCLQIAVSQASQHAMSVAQPLFLVPPNEILERKRKSEKETQRQQQHEHEQKSNNGESVVATTKTTTTSARKNEDDTVLPATTHTTAAAAVEVVLKDGSNNRVDHNG